MGSKSLASITSDIVKKMDRLSPMKKMKHGEGDKGMRLRWFQTVLLYICGKTFFI